MPIPLSMLITILQTAHPELVCNNVAVCEDGNEIAEVIIINLHKFVKEEKVMMEETGDK